jgi:hypothetical protein
MGNDSFDATILTNAVIWVCEKEDSPCDPILVSIDSHFYGQKKKIYGICKRHTKHARIPLKIESVWDA